MKKWTLVFTLLIGAFGLAQDDLAINKIANLDAALGKLANFSPMSPSQKSDVWRATFEEFLLSDRDFTPEQIDALGLAIELGEPELFTIHRSDPRWEQTVYQPLKDLVAQAEAVFSEGVLDRSPLRGGVVQAWLLMSGVFSAGDCDCAGHGSSCGGLALCAAVSCNTKTVTINGVSTLLNGKCTGGHVTADGEGDDPDNPDGGDGTAHQN